MDKKILVRAAFCTAPAKKDNVDRIDLFQVIFTLSISLSCNGRPQNFKLQLMEK